MKRYITPLLLGLLILLAACSQPQNPVPPTQTPASLEASPTLAPTGTPTPLPGKAVLLTGGNANPNLAAQAQALISEKAAPSGMSVESKESLQPADLSPEIKLVVALVQPANLAELLAAAPQTQFIVITSTALEPGANLTVIQLQTEQQAFVAGLVTTLLSDSWRSAGLIPADTPNLQNAFLNGGQYFCGVCSPGWPLGVTFPLVNGAAAPADGAAWAASAADFFDNGKVEAFYLSAAATLPEVTAYLAGKSQFETGVKVVGELPPPAELRAQWGATVEMDPLEALRQALPAALAGSSAGSLKAPVTLSNINPDILSPGRLELVQKIMTQLAEGIISPMSVPQ